MLKYFQHNIAVFLRAVLADTLFLFFAAQCCSEADVCHMQVAMMDPVIAADGHTYERTAVQHWLQGSSLSPVTGDKLPHNRLVPNVSARAVRAQLAQVF